MTQTIYIHDQGFISTRVKDTGCVSCGKNIHSLTSEATNLLIKIVSPLALIHKVDVHYSLEIPLLLVTVVVLWLFLISFRAGG